MICGLKKNSAGYQLYQNEQENVGSGYTLITSQVR
jgi:hypothetical protein